MLMKRKYPLVEYQVVSCVTPDIVSAYVIKLALCETDDAFHRVRDEFLKDMRMNGLDFFFLGLCFACFYDDFHRSVRDEMLKKGDL